MAHLVKMQEKHGKDGLIGLTVCLNTNDYKDQEFVTEATKILKQEKIPLTNLLLKMDVDAAMKRLQMDDDAGFPRVFVFDRRGRWKQFDADTLEQIDQWIEKFLRSR